MKYEASTVQEYIDQVPADRKAVLTQLRKVIKKNIPKGFKEELSYGMPGWVVPHSKYPDGYHCDPKLPLPFLNMASQKSFIAVYHSGLYSDSDLFDWWTAEYPKHCNQKLNMGKCCVRFKKMDDIPYNLIGELVSKITVDEWIDIYENAVKKK